MNGGPPWEGHFTTPNWNDAPMSSTQSATHRSNARAPIPNTNNPPIPPLMDIFTPPQFPGTGSTPVDAWPWATNPLANSWLATFNQLHSLNNPNLQNLSSNYPNLNNRHINIPDLSQVQASLNHQQLQQQLQQFQAFHSIYQSQSSLNNVDHQQQNRRNPNRERLKEKPVKANPPEPNSSTGAVQADAVTDTLQDNTEQENKFRDINPTEFDCFPANAKFVVMETSFEDSIRQSIEFSSWRSSGRVGRQLKMLYNHRGDEETIYLVVYVRGSDTVSGVAEMTSDVGLLKRVDIADRMLRGFFEVKWRFVKDIPVRVFQDVGVLDDGLGSASEELQVLDIEDGWVVLDTFLRFRNESSVLDYFGFNAEDRKKQEAGEDIADVNGSETVTELAADLD